ncbi:MAG: hypothetical protein V3V08_07995 [Nannocystaceae bacterium]
MPRRIDRYLVGELAPRHHGHLLDHVRSCEACRLHYDRASAALRVFEGRDSWSPAELDRVGARLFASSPGDENGASATRRRWIGLTSTAVMTTALLLWLRPGRDHFAARGVDDDTTLGIQAMCGRPLHSAEEGCRIDEELTFAYWVDEDDIPARDLVIFGVDEHGSTMYYAPTPADPATIATKTGTWEPANLAVQLAVNHRPGGVVIYALLPPAGISVSIQEIDRFAAALVTQPPTRLGDLPWVRRLDTRFTESVCPHEDDCQSVELSILLREALP